MTAPVVSNTETPELRVRVDELQAATVSSSSNFTGNTLQSASMHRVSAEGAIKAYGEVRYVTGS